MVGVWLLIHSWLPQIPLIPASLSTGNHNTCNKCLKTNVKEKCVYCSFAAGTLVIIEATRAEIGNTETN